MSRSNEVGLPAVLSMNAAYQSIAQSIASEFKEMKIDCGRDVLALHEAAHAVIAMSCCIGVRSLSIRGDIDNFGTIAYDLSERQKEIDDKRLPDVPYHRRRIVMALAGPCCSQICAEIAGVQPEDWPDWMGDVSVAAERMIVIGENPSTAFEMYRQIAFEALRVTERWSAVLKIADLVLDKTDLDASDLAIIRVDTLKIEDNLRGSTVPFN